MGRGRPEVPALLAGPGAREVLLEVVWPRAVGWMMHFP